MESSQQFRMQVAVIGAGRMGRHHVRTYKNLPQAHLVGVVDTDFDRADETAEEFATKAYPDTDALLKAHPQLQAVTIAVPTAHHLAAAKPLLSKKIACLIEKPLASTIEEAHALAELAKRHEVVLQVGHTERFNPAVRAVTAMNITPRFIEVHRVSPMTFRSLDVGVVMDMMIHDLDIVLMLARCPLVKVDAAGVAVLGKHEDIANTRLVFASGCVANVTASRLALKTERKMRLFSEDAYVSLDYQKRDGLVIRKSKNVEALETVRSRIAQGSDLSDLDYSQLVSMEQLTMDIPAGESDPLTAELSSFLSAVKENKPPVVDAAAGQAAVEAAQRVVEALRAHQWEGLPHPLP